MKTWEKPMVMATFSEDELLAQQHDLAADGWALWGRGAN